MVRVGLHTHHFYFGYYLLPHYIVLVVTVIDWLRYLGRRIPNSPIDVADLPSIS